MLSVLRSNSLLWTIDGTLLDATTLGQLGPGSDGYKGVFRIPQSSSIIGVVQSDCLVSYPGRSLGGSLIRLKRRSRCILQHSWFSLLSLLVAVVKGTKIYERRGTKNQRYMNSYVSRKTKKPTTMCLLVISSCFHGVRDWTVSE